jgi:Ran GTPase-activating protein (RanGAP) involved in mRNA processing and transport
LTSVKIRSDLPGQRLAGVLGQCPELNHLLLWNNAIAAAGTESLAGVLAQCIALARLNLTGNKIGAQSLAGVLGQCPALAHLNLRDNGIEAVGGGGLTTPRSSKIFSVFPLQTPCTACPLTSVEQTDNTKRRHIVYIQWKPSALHLRFELNKSE